MIERKALIFNIQKYNTYDGPGVRTIVFFKGCPLRCKWCSNPESQQRKLQVMLKVGACVNCGACVKVCPVGIHKMTPSGVHEIDYALECIGCMACEQACTAAALRIAGEYKPISEILDVIEEDRPFYETSGGGLTLGGGEPLMQPEAAINLLMACKQRSINTAIETCGYARPEVLMKTAEFVDHFLFDLKHMNSERHYEMTGVRNESILKNLTWLLENRHDVKIRVPLLKGFNDDDNNIKEMIAFLKPYQEQKTFSGIDLLPYHRLGVGKYEQLGMEYQIVNDPGLDDADLARVEACIQETGFPVTIIRH